MNENRHPIDDLFRDGLEHAAMEPPMHVWERIDQKRTPVYKLVNNFKQNSRWYLSVAAVLALLSSAAFVLLLDEKPNTLTNGSEVNTAPETAYVEKGQGNTTSPAEKNNGNTTMPLPEKTGDASEHAMAQVPGFNSHVQTSPSAHAPANTNPAQSKKSTTPANAAKTGEGNKDGASTPDKPREEETVVVPPYEIPTYGNGDGERERRNMVPGTIPQRRNAGPVTPLPKPEPPVVAEINGKQDTEGQQTDKQKTVVQPPITPSRWSIELMGSYNFVNRAVKGQADYLNTRKAAETPGSAFTLQLRTGYRLFEHSDVLYFRTGLSYSRINETLKFNKTEYYQSVEDRQVTGVIVDPITGPRTITYTVHDTVTKSRVTPVTSNNRYTFVDVPLVLTWNAYTNKRLTLNASAGMMVNLSFTQQGQILGPVNNEIIDLSQAGNPFRAYAGADLLFNVGAAWKLGGEQSHFDLLFEPGLRLGLGSLTKGGSEFSQRYQTLNLFTGLRYRF